MKNKKIYLVIALIGVMSIIFGVTYAFFTYNKTGSNQKIIAGDISMSFLDNNDSINLVGVFPETREEARSRDDNYVTFTIEGTNTSNKTIYYEIDLIHGDDHDGLIRFNDKDLRFDLVEVVDGEDTIIQGNVSFDEINNSKIWVDRIDSIESAHIKLNDPIFDVNVENCVNFFNTGEDLTLEQDGYQSFCEGTGKVESFYYNGMIDFKTMVALSLYENDSVYELVENNVISNLRVNSKYYRLTPSYNVDDCISILSNNFYDMTSTGDGFDSFCHGEDTIMGYSIDDLAKIDTFEKNEIVTSIYEWLHKLSLLDTENVLLSPAVTEVNKTYKLRMWLGEDVLISDTNPDATYSASTYKNHYASIKVRVVGDFEERMQQVYYAFAEGDIFEPDVDIMTLPNITNYYRTLGKNVFIKFEGPQKSVCIIKDNNLECFKSNNYENEKVHLQSIFTEPNCEDYSANFNCNDGAFHCRIYSNGSIECNNYLNSDHCYVQDDGIFTCGELLN